MKVLWVSHGSNRGGAELVLEEGARCLREVGVETVVVLPGDGELGAMLDASGIKTVKAYLPWWAERERPESFLTEIRGLVSAVRGMCRVIRDESPDVVLTNTLTIPAAAFAAKLSGVPHVWMIQEFMDPDHGLKFYFGRRFCLWCVNRLSAKAAVASDAVRAEFEGVLGKGKIDKVRYAVDIPEPKRRIEKPVPSAFRLVLVGARYPAKGQETAVRAVALLKARGRDVSLELVGYAVPGYEEFLLHLCRELDVEDRVFQIAETDDPYAYSSMADAVLVCSKQEAFGRVTIEGMKLGRPVIVSSSGAGSELVEDGVRGLLFEAFDSVQLADKIEMLIDEPALADTLGRNAKEWSRENFTPERYGKALHRICEAAIARSRR